jgi:hypothetical protein
VDHQVASNWLAGWLEDSTICMLFRAINLPTRYFYFLHSTRRGVSRRRYLWRVEWKEKSSNKEEEEEGVMKIN